MTAEPRIRRISEGSLLWEPPEQRKTQANITRYLNWLQERHELDFISYDQLWRWSVTHLEDFWSSIWDYFQIRSHQPYQEVLSKRTMPGANWFSGTRLNYAEHALRRQDEGVAVVSGGEDRQLRTMTYAELFRETASVAASFRELGIQRGDRVAALLPNIPEALVAFLATASLGAVWSSCSPEFGTRSVLDRFHQIGPRLLLAVDGYRYKGDAYRCLESVSEIQQALPSVGTVVLVPRLAKSPSLGETSSVRLWEELLCKEDPLVFEGVPFDHPLWLLYSSGTTGLPKPIVHGHGGILLEHLKERSLHLDLSSKDRFFWFTTTGWMMWNFLVSGLLTGTTLVLYEGSPFYPDMGALWKFAEQTETTYFGTSASHIQSCVKAGIDPAREFDLSSLTGLGSTGSPLSPEGFAWVYEKVKEDLLLGSLSGGTDVCTAFVGPSPLLPVHAGEIQCPQLGARVESYSPDGEAVLNEVGELVVTEPMPSMPIFFWGDQGNQRYRESYFQTFPGVWCHGDWIKITPRGSCVISGRSDANLNRGGIRMGTSEFYRVVEELPEVLDSLVVDTGYLGKNERLFLFVVLQDGMELDLALVARINEVISRELSPRHVPNEIRRITEVPPTLSGKKLEVPVKLILSGVPVGKAVSEGAVGNPETLRIFADLAGQLQ